MSPSRSTKSRLAWLLLCLSAGAATGLGGVWFSGNPYWLLAIPAALAVGWLFVANPEQCSPPAARRAGRTPNDERLP